MVEITIYVEGVMSTDASVLTIDNSALFRESFHKLFSQKLNPEDFDLRIIPFGTITQARKKLAYIEKKGINGVLLIDLDAPKEQRNTRIKTYSGYNTEIVFFMIHEMEAWILSQTDKIEVFAKNEGLARKKCHENISNNPLLKGKHPEVIVKPSSKLDTILRQYFVVSRKRNGKERKTGKRYSKTKDAPKLIGLLDLEPLIQTFDEANRMIDYIKK